MVPAVITWRELLRTVIAKFAFWAFLEIQIPLLRVFTELPGRSQAV